MSIMLPLKCSKMHQLMLAENYYKLVIGKHCMCIAFAMQEGVVMATMDHENVVRLYCVCMSRHLMLVSPFVSLGALKDYVKKHKYKLSPQTIINFSLQIAKVLIMHN